MRKYNNKFNIVVGQRVDEIIHDLKTFVLTFPSRGLRYQNLD
jgi:hypothetical protein